MLSYVAGYLLGFALVAAVHWRHRARRRRRYVKPGGRLVYVTCSVLPEENGDRVNAFLDTTDAFKPVPVLDVLKAGGGLAEGAEALLEPCLTEHGTLQLSPGRTDTDGFYICVMERVG